MPDIALFAPTPRRHLLVHNMRYFCVLLSHNEFGSICVSVCVSVCNALTCETLAVKSSILICKYVHLRNLQVTFVHQRYRVAVTVMATKKPST